MAEGEKYFKSKIYIKKPDGQEINIIYDTLPMTKMLKEISNSLRDHLKSKEIKYIISEIKRINENMLFEDTKVRIEIVETKLVAIKMYAPKKFDRSL